MNSEIFEATKGIIFSVVMPTYNSGKTLQKSLASICGQNFNSEKYEVLIIDGGSTDDTIEIAKNFHAKIFQNDKRLPEYAKEIGIKHAKGKYIIFHDSDEVLQNMDSFLLKEEVLRNFEDVGALVSAEYKNPCAHSAFGDYTNYVGDPFTAFVYGWSAESNLERYDRQYKKITETDECALYEIREGDIFPIIDACGHVFEKGEYLENISVSEISTFNITKTRKFGVIKNDVIWHYSSASLQQILKKIQFRVINNVFGDRHSGFSQRESSIPMKYKIQKYVFLLYGFSFIFPLLRGVIWSIKRKNSIFVFESIFAFYTAFCIVFYMIQKIFGIRKVNKTYG